MYKNMAEILTDEKSGNVKVKHFVVPENDLYATLHGITPGEYVKLYVGNDLMMSNTQMEKLTNYDFVNAAHGNVLIGVLGIGLIILAIQDKGDVTSITVIENNKDVINIMQKQLPLNEKVRIVCDDVFSYAPSESDKYNTVYMDIWPYINKEIYEREMKPLISRYRKYMVPKKDDENRWINCWCKNEARYGKRI